MAELSRSGAELSRSGAELSQSVAELSQSGAELSRYGAELSAHSYTASEIKKKTDQNQDKEIQRRLYGQHSPSIVTSSKATLERAWALV